MQEVGLERLAAWVRETARSGGLASAPFCFGLQDAAAKHWQTPAVEKRCLILAPYCPSVVQHSMGCLWHEVYILEYRSFTDSWPQQPNCK